MTLHSGTITAHARKAQEGQSYLCDVEMECETAPCETGKERPPTEPEGLTLLLHCSA